MREGNPYMEEQDALRGKDVDEELPRAAPPRVARIGKGLSTLDLIG